MQAIETVCAFVGEKGIFDLEKLATASWIRSQEKKSDEDEVAERLTHLKPHISEEDARAACCAVADWLAIV